MSLLKQVELLSNNTFKLVMQNKLEFSTYAAKLVVDCKAANATELQRWQLWLDMSDAERFNITEKAIEEYIDGIRSLRKSSYDHYIPDEDIKDILYECTNKTYWSKQAEYLIRNGKILESF